MELSWKSTDKLTCFGVSQGILGKKNRSTLSQSFTDLPIGKSFFWKKLSLRLSHPSDLISQKIKKGVWLVFNSGDSDCDIMIYHLTSVQNHRYDYNETNEYFKSGNMIHQKLGYKNTSILVCTSKYKKPVTVIMTSWFFIWKVLKVIDMARKTITEYFKSGKWLIRSRGKKNVHFCTCRKIQKRCDSHCDIIFSSWQVLK